MTDFEPLSPEEGVTRFPHYHEPSVRDSTLQDSRTRLNHFLDWCEEIDTKNLNNLSDRDLADFVAWHQGDIAPITSQKQLSTMRAVFGFWADIKSVEDSLHERIHTPEFPDSVKARDAHLSTNCAESILDYLDRYQYVGREHVIMALLW